MTSELAEKIDQRNAPDKLRDTIYGYQQHFGLALTGVNGQPLIAPEKFARVAYTAIRKNDLLAQASLPSLMGALMACAQLGLEPSGPLGQAYLVPFRDNTAKTIEVQLIIGYQGLIELAYRSGRLTSITAQVIHANDFFEWELGTNAHVLHRPSLDDRGEMIGVYAIANLVGGGQVFEVMSKAQVDSHRKMSKAQGDQSPWATHYEAMARKTVVRQLFKWLPASVEDHPALGADGGVFRQIPEKDEDYGDPSVIDVEEAI